MWPISVSTNRNGHYGVATKRSPIEHPAGVESVAPQGSNGQSSPSGRARVVEYPEDPKPARLASDSNGDYRAAIVDIAKPIHRCDLARELKEMREKLNVMARELHQAVIHPERETVERMFEGTFLLARHRHQLHEIREMLIRCMASVQNRISETEEATGGWDHRRLDRFMETGKRIIALLDRMDLNAELLAMATRRHSIVEAWERHKSCAGELHALVDTCGALTVEVA